MGALRKGAYFFALKKYLPCTDRYLFYYHVFFLQKEGKQMKRSVKDSRRPMSMEIQTMILVPAGRSVKPGKFPSCAGMIPVLLMVIIESPREPGISRPVNVMSRAHRKIKPR